jgi:Domain of unknown function (DUF5348)
MFARRRVSADASAGGDRVGERVTLERTLQRQPSGRWAICRLRDPYELTSGDVFRVEVDGELRVTRMEHLWGEGYYSVDDYPLRNGMRAALGGGGA